MNDRIILAHGGGGDLTRRLIDEHIVSRLGNEFLDPLTDSAVLPVQAGRVCLTTDSFVVQPLEFPGGDIGRLAVCGTVNDLAVMGARPLALTLGLIIEEGVKLDLLDRILDSIAATAAEAGVRIVTGDTKVIEHRQQDGLFINTAGLGILPADRDLGTHGIRPGDAVVVTGNLADHGLAVMSAREGLAFETELRSDVAPLNGLAEAMLESGAAVRFMRDPTRGGVAGVLADLCEATGLSIVVAESALPISKVAWHTAEMLGLDPLSVANEGKIVAVVDGDAPTLVEACRRHPLGRRAAIIGRFTGAEPPLVELISRAGGRRIVQRPYGEDLPRIC